MTFATVAGVELRMEGFERLADEIGGGAPQRTLSGERRGTPLWRARSWQGTAICFTPAEAEALRALADDSTPRMCAGDAFPAGGVRCHVECTGEGYEREGSEYLRRPALTFREAL